MTHKKLLFVQYICQFMNEFSKLIGKQARLKIA